MAFITLHIRPGTFEPIRTPNIYISYYTISQQTASIINNAYHEKRPVIAIGTTSCHALESAFDQKIDSTSIFIYTGYQLSAIQGILTIFYTPKSTLYTPLQAVKL